MPVEPVEVSARWGERGFFPRHFVWRGQKFQVESTGRQWEDEEGLHVLCMVTGGAVFELVFRLQPAGWWVKPPVGAIASV
jgi:hypothetical protein